MSIFDQTADHGLLVGGPDPLRLFTDRTELVERFSEYVNGNEPIGTILYLTGMGGNGKSFLLRYLRAHFSRRSSRVVWAARRDELVTAPSSLAEADGADLPVAYLDFGAPPTAEQRPQEALSGLFALKRQYASYDLQFPSFDFAAVTYLHRTGGDVGTRIKELFPAAEASLAADVVDALATLPVLSATRSLVEIVNNRMDQALTHWQFRRRVSKECVAEILSLSSDRELLDALPGYFAQDLGEALRPSGRHERVLLLLDTHEAFWGEGASPGPDCLSGELLARDEWVRALLGHLDVTRGCVAVVAGRQPPQWHVAPRVAIPSRYLEVRPVAQWTKADADDYLRRAGVASGATRAELIEYASVGTTSVSPYFLGLCADVVGLGGAPTASSPDSAPAVPGVDRERALVTRLLSYATADVESAIVGMSAARSFSWQTFQAVGLALGFAVDRPTYERLTRFSFVSRMETGATGGQATFSLHRLLQSFLRRLRPADVLRAHEALESFHAARGEDDYLARIEAVYHRAFNRSHQAGLDWLHLADSWLSQGRFDRCRALLPVHRLEVLDPSSTDRYLERVGRIYIGLGDLEPAMDVAEQLPSGSAPRALLLADIAFVRGDFLRAKALVEEILDAATGSDRLRALFKLTEIELFRGQFGAASAFVEEGRTLADRTQSGADRARWLVLDGEVGLFAGRVSSAAEAFEAALEELDGCEPDECDQSLTATALNDLGLVHEVAGQWDAALTYYERAHAIRQECADARGVAHSLHALAKARAGRGDHARAAEHLDVALNAATILGDLSLSAKVRHTRARAAMRNGRLDDARQHLDKALRLFVGCRAPFDIAHGLLTSARISRSSGDDARADSELAQARLLVSEGGFGLLTHTHPELLGAAERIAAGITGFCTGDAVGAPWEGRPPEEIPPGGIDEVPRREDWPRGSTTDDTAQMVLVADVLVEGGGAAEFLAALSAALPTIRGIGPSTAASVERYRREGALVAVQGSTNGAAMRALPFGWAFGDPDQRRAAVVANARTTHGDDRAVLSAVVVAAMAAASVRDATTAATLLDVAVAEAASAADVLGLAEEAWQVLALAASGRWDPPVCGVSLDALETVATVLHVLRRETSYSAAVRLAVGLGGDTDTVAALVGGLLAPLQPLAVTSSPWQSRVLLPAEDEVTRLAAGLAGASGG